MDEQLLMLVSDRLDADTSLDDDVGLLVLAACEGDDSLIGVISGESQPTRPAAERRAKRSTTEPPGAYVRSVSVEGFRGVGERCALELTPGPGLTLVVGRNGSGKSNFVEALEVLLTDESRRWSNREKAWSEG